jgi:hypothetical protein
MVYESPSATYRTTDSDGMEDGRTDGATASEQPTTKSDRSAAAANSTRARYSPEA